MTDKNLKEALDFAIKREQDAADLYHYLEEKATDPAARKQFQELAQMEEGHKRGLERFDLEQAGQAREATPLPDLKISDYLVDVEIDKANVTTQEALIYAAKSEEKAVQLYSKLAERFVNNPAINKFFSTLAIEEGRHKHQLEAYYDDHFLKEN